jgi:hypothetical protein
MPTCCLQWYDSEIKEGPMLTRLFAAVILLTAMTASAQSQPQQSSNTIASPAIAADNSAENEFRISPYPRIDSDEPEDKKDKNDKNSDLPDDPIKAQSVSREQLIKLLDAERNGTGSVPGTQLLSDGECLSIRSYRVVRDDPHSDATHFDGYTTCVPAARFRLYTTDERR